MTWEIVTGIIALISVFGTVAAYSSKQTKLLTELSTTLKTLDKTLNDLKDSNKESHKDFYKQLHDHDTRIKLLEEEK